MGDYIERGIERAQDDNAELVIIQLDTPGGSVDTTSEIVQIIRGSDVPVVVYVSPRGAMAASAGALITLSGHASAMAPETVIGAASPISGDGSDLDDTSEQKIQNILLADIRSLTEGRRPPEAVELAEKMITDAEAVSVEEAEDIGLIDYVASDRDELIDQMDGQAILLDNDETITLRLDGLPVETVGMSFIEELLMALTNPAIVFILLSTGVLLVIIELRAPGGFVAGLLGGVAILLSIYGLGILPINFLGLAFVALAAILFVSEVLIPETNGALSIAGGVSLLVAGLILFNDARIDEFGGIPLWVVVLQSAGIGLMSAAIIYYALRNQNKPDTTGSEALIGMVGEVRSPLAPTGSVFVNGEWWKAETTDGSHVPRKEPVRVVDMIGMLLRVEPVDEFPVGDGKRKKK
jgi:membrane-bound serine protease (ClpP class)